MKGIINLIFLVFGGYSLFIAYKLGYDPFWFFKHSGELILKPADIIADFFEKMFDAKNAKDLKYGFLSLGIFLIGCSGGGFFFFGSSSSSEE